MHLSYFVPSQTLWDFTRPLNVVFNVQRPAPSPLLPSLEFARSAEIFRLHERYNSLCKNELSYEEPPKGSFHRWVFAQLALSSSSVSSASSSASSSSESQLSLGPSTADPILRRPELATETTILTREFANSMAVRVRFNYYSLAELQRDGKAYCNAATKWLNELLESAQNNEEEKKTLTNALSMVEETQKQHFTSSSFSSFRSHLSSSSGSRKEKDPQIDIANHALKELRGSLGLLLGTRPTKAVKFVCESLIRSAKDAISRLDSAKKRAARFSGGEEEEIVLKAASDTIPRKSSVSASSPASSSSVESQFYSAIVYMSQTEEKDRIVLSSTHVEKLKQLFTLHNPSPSSYSFETALYCLAKRYQSVFGEDSSESPSSSSSSSSSSSFQRKSNYNNGNNNSSRSSAPARSARREAAGFHAATPETAMNCLSSLLECSMECFASPFNCFFANFCSAFPDIDAYFGSKGSFFDADIVEGSLQVNPPFVEEPMTKAAERIDFLLERSVVPEEEQRPLSFLVLVPNWMEPITPAIAIMLRSPFLKKEVVIPGNGKHVYIIGDQHLPASERHYAPPHETRIFLLQNEAGATKWPLSDDQLQQIVASMTGKIEQTL